MIARNFKVIPGLVLYGLDQGCPTEAPNLTGGDFERDRMMEMVLLTCCLVWVWSEKVAPYRCDLEGSISLPGSHFALRFLATVT